MLKEGFLFTFISAFMALFPVANPVGAGFLVNGLLSGLDDEDRKSIIRRIITDLSARRAGQPGRRAFRADALRALAAGNPAGRRAADLPHRPAMAQRLGLLGGARAGQGCQSAPQNSPRIAGLLPDHLPDQHRPGQRLGHPDADGLGEHEGRLGQRAALLCDHRAGSRADVPDPLPVPVAGRAHHTENRHQRQHRHQQDGRLLHLLRRRADRRDGIAKLFHLHI